MNPILQSGKSPISLNIKHITNMFIKPSFDPAWDHKVICKFHHHLLLDDVHLILIPGQRTNLDFKPVVIKWDFGKVELGFDVHSEHFTEYQCSVGEYLYHVIVRGPGFVSVQDPEFRGPYFAHLEG